MLRKITVGSQCAALCLASTPPALGQDHRFTGFDAPRGATATVNLRIPLGSRPGVRTERPNLGLTIGYGRALPSSEPDGRSAIRSVDLLDLRLDEAGLQRARLAGLDLREPLGSPLHLTDDGGTKSAWLIAFFGALTFFAFGYLAFGRGGDDEGDQESPPPESPGLG
jgi:hypothetical protein